MDTESFLLFFRELVCYASIGYNWLFLVLRFERLTQDILIYVEMLEQLLGENALARCTIVFTHCKLKDINRAKCIEANRDSPRIVTMLEKAHSIIFGDMDTFEDDDSDVETRNRINQSQAKRRQHFMEQLLQQIDSTDDNMLTLEESWFRTYWARFTQYIGYCIEKIFGKSNELSKHYRLTAALKKEIPVTIYYESCSICLDLILEIWNTEPKACVTKCGHIFHYNCLKEWFTKKKECPNCRADLRSLPERMVGQRIGLRPINDVLKTPPAAPPAVPPVVLSAPPSRPPTPLGGEVEELMSTEESNNTNST
ncbi:unnamed protein product [Rotaria sp. Silwood2]|nr:unnamed protein product [Rotaria sp. Silwood2]CAF3384799.1 unnamed protein product [Rotaria sp. Silwood2]